MRIVLDANVVIAALMKSRATLTILTSLNHEFYAPKRIVDEIRKYKQLICERSGQEEDEFEQVFDALTSVIHLVEQAEYSSFIERAVGPMQTRDAKDADYIACALAVEADFIWSNDRDFDAQSLVQVKTTDQFIEEGKQS